MVWLMLYWILHIAVLTFNVHFQMWKNCERMWKNVKELFQIIDNNSTAQKMSNIYKIDTWRHSKRIPFLSRFFKRTIRTDVRTDRRTDGWMDKPSYRYAKTQHKNANSDVSFSKLINIVPCEGQRYKANGWTYGRTDGRTNVHTNSILV